MKFERPPLTSASKSDLHEKFYYYLLVIQIIEKSLKQYILILNQVAQISIKQVANISFDLKLYRNFQNILDNSGIGGKSKILEIFLHKDDELLILVDDFRKSRNLIIHREILEKFNDLNDDYINWKLIEQEYSRINKYIKMGMKIVEMIDNRSKKLLIIIDKYRIKSARLNLASSKEAPGFRPVGVDK